MAPDPQTKPSAPQAQERPPAWRRFVPRSSILWATILLFGLSWLLAPGSVSSNSINAMMPFAGILAIAAVGQTVIIMQRGIDLSVVGMITLAGMGLCELVAVQGVSLGIAILIVFAVAALIGLANGLVVGYLGVSPLVATLAMNAILLGAVLHYSEGSPARAPEALADFTNSSALGIAGAGWVALAFVAAVAFVVARTVWGRRFVAVGASVRAARASGIPVERYQLSAYVLGALCYAVAGIVLAGLLNTPNIGMGEEYLLASIAAAVVGGTALTGGKGNILGTAIGALFLTQLTQLVLSMGAPTSTQLVIQSVVIAVAAGIQVLDRDAIGRLGRRLRLLPASRQGASQ